MRPSPEVTDRISQVSEKVRATFQKGGGPNRARPGAVWILLLVSVVLVLALFLAVLSLWRPKPVLFSSPVALRPNSEFAGVGSPGRDMPPLPPSAVHSNNITRAVFLSVRDISARPGSAAAEYGPRTLHETKAAEAVPIGAGSIRLASIGIVTAGSRQKTHMFEVSGPMRQFAPDLTPIATTDPTTNLPDVTMDGNVLQFPGARFIFACSNLPAVKPLRFAIFDARTQFRAGESRTPAPASAITNRFTFDCALSLVHQTPVEIIVTVALGPIQAYSLDFKEGAQLSHPRGSMRILAIQDGLLRPEYGRLQTSFRTTPGAQGASVVFQCWPSALEMPVDFVFLDRDGSAIASEVSSAGNALALAFVSASVEDVKSVRIEHYPSVHRLRLSAPELPGLPEKNRNIQNLFDAQIPWLASYSPHHTLEVLANLLQMDLVGMPAFRSGFVSEIPFHRADTTVRALFDEIQTHMSPDERLVVDSENNVIRVERPSLFQTVEDLVQRFGP